MNEYHWFITGVELFDVVLSVIVAVWSSTR